MIKQTTHFPKIDTLSMSDMVQWVGQKIVDRGMEYLHDKTVSKLSITADGVLLANVQGAELYLVAVRMIDNEVLQSICSCSHGIDCKHGVATLLQYIDCLKQGKIIPLTKNNDPCLQLLSGDFKIKLQQFEGQKSSSISNLSLELYLADFTKKRLISQICSLAKDIPQVQAYFKTRMQDVNSDNSALVKRLRKEMNKASNYPYIGNHPDDYTFSDFSKIRKMMQLLLEKNMFDELLNEGKEFLDLANTELSQSHDEGETWDEVLTCVPMVFEALKNSSLEGTDKLIWALDAVMGYDYDVFDGFKELLYEDYPLNIWNELVLHLNTRLHNTPFKSYAYNRNKVCEWLVYALKKAGRAEEILQLYESEAKITGNYDRLIEYFIQNKKLCEALNRIEIAEKRSGEETWQLRDYKRKIYMEQKDWQALLLLELICFTQNPSTRSFIECKKIAEKFSLWTTIRLNLLEFLATGKPPWEQKEWVLELKKPKMKIKSRISNFPDLPSLIEIAIEEKLPEDVLRWYNLLHKNKLFYNDFHDRVATSIQEKFPEKAITIWQNLTEKAASQTNRRGYEEAEKYLEKLKKLMYTKKMQAEWIKYILHIRGQHSRKPLFMKVLDEITKSLLPEK